jgi:hypothetical protein
VKKEAKEKKKEKILFSSGTPHVIPFFPSQTSSV